MDVLICAKIEKSFVYIFASADMYECGSRSSYAVLAATTGEVTGLLTKSRSICRPTKTYSNAAERGKL